MRLTLQQMQCLFAAAGLGGLDRVSWGWRGVNSGSAGVIAGMPRLCPKTRWPGITVNALVRKGLLEIRGGVRAVVTEKGRQLLEKRK